MVALVAVAALPVILIPHVPLAQTQVSDGAYDPISLIPYPAIVVGFPVIPLQGAALAVVAVVALVAVAALPVIDIPAVPAEILAGLSDVIADPFPAKLPAVTEPVTFAFHQIVAFHDNQRFAHLFPVAPRSF